MTHWKNIGVGSQVGIGGDGKNREFNLCFGGGGRFWIEAVPEVRLSAFKVK